MPRCSLVIMAMLVRLLTWVPALTGLLVTGALLPVGALMGRAMDRARRVMVKHTDERIKLVSEVVTGEAVHLVLGCSSPRWSRVRPFTWCWG